MSQIEKLIRKARTSPQNIRFSELKTIITRVGQYEFDNVEGSHWTYRREGFYPITITFTSDKAKVEEVKKVIKLFEEAGIL